MLTQSGIVITDQFIGGITAVLLALGLTAITGSLAWMYRAIVDVANRLTLVEKSHGKFFEILEANAVKSLLTVMNPLTEEDHDRLRRADESSIGLQCLDDWELKELNIHLDQERRAGNLSPTHQKSADELVAIIQKIMVEREFMSGLRWAISPEQARRYQSE